MKIKYNEYLDILYIQLKELHDKHLAVTLDTKWIKEKIENYFKEN